MSGNAEQHPEREQKRPPGANAVDRIAPFAWWGLEAVALYFEYGTHHEGPNVVVRALVMVGQLAVLLRGTSAS
jgi:hypothetical protein